MESCNTKYNSLRENVNNLFKHVGKKCINCILNFLEILKEMYISNYTQFEDCMNLLNDKYYELIIPQQNINIYGFDERLVFISFIRLAIIVFEFKNTQKNFKINKLMYKMIYLYNSYSSDPLLQPMCYLAFVKFENFNDNYENPFILLKYLNLVTNKDVLSHLCSVYIVCFEALICVEENLQVIDFNLPYNSLIDMCNSCVDSNLIDKYDATLKKMVTCLGKYYERSLTYLKSDIKIKLFALMDKFKNQMTEENDVIMNGTI